MKKIFRFIAAIIKIYIINPILRFYHFYFCHIYIEDNPRNEAMLDYFSRVAEDPTVQPQTPTEIFFENSIKSDYEYYFPEDEPWEKYRQSFYTDLALEMLEYRWIDDTQ